MNRGSAFPVTRHSVFRELGSSDPQVRRRAFGTLATVYWKPVYKYIRLRWNLAPEDAEDLTQEFFAEAFERRWLENYDATRARFRTYLRIHVDGIVGNARKAASRVKRGGDAEIVSIDFLNVELELGETMPPADVTMDEFFRREWIRSVFELGVERLRDECVREGKRNQFAVFARYDIDALQSAASVTYSDLAREFELPETQVTNYLAFARRRFRHHLLDALRELTANDAEFVEAAKEVFGVTV